MACIEERCSLLVIVATVTLFFFGESPGILWKVRSKAAKSAFMPMYIYVSNLGARASCLVDLLVYVTTCYVHT